MPSGSGFEEIILIAILVLILFGPKGVAGIMRDLGKLTAKLKKYRDEFTRELMALNEPVRSEAEIRADERKRIRKTMMHAVATMPEAQRDAESLLILNQVLALDEFKNARKIFITLSLPSEVKTDPIVRAAIDAGKEVFIPLCVPADKSMKLARLTDLEADVVPGLLGIREPRPEKVVEIDPLSIDFFIIPGVAFDQSAARLGHGAGYFDRFLVPIKGKRPVTALAFSTQMYCYSVPVEPHDISPDKIITPTAVITERPDSHLTAVPSEPAPSA